MTANFRKELIARIAFKIALRGLDADTETAYVLLDEESRHWFNFGKWWMDATDMQTNRLVNAVVKQAKKEVAIRERIGR